MTDTRTVPIAQLLADKVLMIGDGYRAKNAELAPDGVPFARAGNVNSGFRFEGADRFPVENLRRAGTKVSRPGDVVFTSKGTVGRFAYVRKETERFVYSPQLCFWRSLRPDVIDPRYLYYWMLSGEFFAQYDAVRAQTDMADYVSLSDQRRMHITLPLMPEQRAVAALLGLLDDKIDLNRKLWDTIAAVLRTLHKGWFLDPDRTAGWPREPLGKHVEAVRGLSYHGAGLAAEGVPLHNLDSVREGGGYKHEGIKHYAGDFQERHLVRPGDLVVANTEQGFDYLLIGCPAIIPDDYGQEGLFSHHLFRIRARPGSPLTRHFLYLLFCDPRFRGLVTSYSNGTTVNMLAADGLRRPALPVPPAELVARFDELTGPLFARQAALHRESTLLARLRDTLLPRLLSGELRVRHPDAAMR